MVVEDQELTMDNKTFRHEYLSAHIRELLATQVRATREQRGWSQETLGQNAGMAQERISVLEDPDYAGMTLKTLKRIAEAFDVALVVRFAPFSEMLTWIDHVSAEQFAVPSYETDAHLAAATAVRAVVTTADQTPSSEPLLPS